MNTILHLLRPKRLALENRWKKSSSVEKSLVTGFTSFGVVFWVSLSFVFYFFISTFYNIEIVGPIVLRKLMEILMLSLFGLLCFSNMVTALSNFYLSDDLELLLSLPISKVDFYFARFVETMGQSSWMAFSLALPIMISYGVVYQASWIYYLLMLFTIISFAIIPTAIGISVASILVSVFPARRIREALVLLGILALIFVFILIRILRPERLANAENFESVASYMAEIQAPIPFFLPPKWASDVLLSSLFGREVAFLQVGLLFTGAIASIGLSRLIISVLYDQGRARAQEARVARLAASPLLDKFINLWTAPLPPIAKAIVQKDIKTFIRDPSQWTQLFLVGSIVIIAIISVANLPLDSFRGPFMQTWLNGLAFLTLALVGFVMAALSARFQFAAVSNEGRGFWVTRTAPVSAKEFLWAKAYPGFLPMLLVGEILAISSTSILDAQSSLIWLGIGTALFLSFGLSGIAVGMGALYPDFKIDSSAKLAATPAGLLYMVTALSLVFLVLALEAPSVYFLISSQITGRIITNIEWGLAIGALVLAASTCVFATFYPIQKGAQKLWERELPNG